MQTADELLSELLDDIPEHVHPVTDADTYFIIDPVSRKVENASGTRNVLMQFDHDSERFTFELSRYVEGHDMTLCNKVKVHYINIGEDGTDENKGVTKSRKDVYECSDLDVNPDNPETVICSWPISRYATQYFGVLSFLVQYLCEAEDGTIVYEWHSDIYEDVEIKQGRNNGPAAVIEYTDLLEQWYARLFGSRDSLIADIVASGDQEKSEINTLATDIASAIETEKQEILALSDSEQAEIEAKGQLVIDSIPDDYTTTHNMADEALRRKADAIVLSDEGKSIVLDDSSGSYILGLGLRGKTEQFTTTGKNLLNLPWLIEKPTSGYNYDLFTKTVGAAAVVSSEQIDKLPVLPAGTYYFYAELETAENNNQIRVMIVNDDGTTANDLVAAEGVGAFTIDTQTRITIRVGTSGEATISNIQIEAGDKYTGYEPYTGGKPSPSPDYPQPFESVVNPAVKMYGKNLVDYTLAEARNSSNTIEIIPDGVLFTGNYYFKIPVSLAKNTKYMCSYVSEDAGKFAIYYSDGTVVDRKTLGGEIITDPEKTAEYLYIYKKDSSVFKEGMVFTNIQLELGDEATPYEPYKPVQTISLTRELRGIPVISGGNYTDSSGRQWVCDEIDFERGKFIQRCFEETVTLWYDDINERYIGSITNPANANCADGNGVPVICDILPFNKDAASTVNGARIAASSTSYLIANYNGQQLGSIKVLYPLATPVETDLTSAEILAFRELRTNATDTTIVNDHNAMMSVKYVADLERYIYKNVSVKERKFEVTTLADQWVAHDNDTWFTQVVSAEVRTNAKVTLQPTAEQQVTLVLDGIAMFAENQNGVVTMYAIGGIPGTDFTVQATEQVVVYA